MRTNDYIRAKIEGLMGWKRGESIAFSFRALQAFVRGKDPEFDKEFASYLEEGGHIYENPKCPHGRKPEDCDDCYREGDLAYDAAREISRRNG